MFDADPVFSTLVTRLASDAAKPVLSTHGTHWGTRQAYDLARLANEHTPELSASQPLQESLDRIEFHPAFHALTMRSMKAKIHCGSWAVGEDEANANFMRNAKLYMAAQVDMGHLLGLSATNAACATVRLMDTIAQDVLPRIVNGQFDSSFEPFWKKKGMLIGLAAAEYGAGSDVSHLNMVAQKDAHDGWRLKGIKSFISCPQADAFVTLARHEAGLSCFFVPRFSPDEGLNGLRYIRKKNTDGLKSTGLVDMGFDNAQGWLIDEPGQGLKALAPLGTFIRLDMCTGLAGLMRAALCYGVNYLCARKVGDAPLIKDPVMSAVLADVALDVAAATILVHRLALAFDRAPDDRKEAAFVRLVLPAVKYMLSQTAPKAIDQIQALLGAHGLTHTRPVARFGADARAIALWDAPQNVAVKDFAHVLAAAPEAVKQALEDVVELLNRDNPHNQHMEAGFESLISLAVSHAGNPTTGVRIAQRLALMSATSLLRGVVSASLADAYESSRISARYQVGYGGLDTAFDPAHIVQTCVPHDANGA